MPSIKPDTLATSDVHWQEALDDVPSIWFDRGVALEVIRACFQAGRSQIRIASGFFTILGWNYIRTYTRGKPVALLVGIDEPGDDRARKVLVKEIMKALRTGYDRDRRLAVSELVERIQSHEFQILDARALNHHAKVYIVDEAVAIIASSNTTGKGLLGQIESGNILREPEKVAQLVKSFDDYFSIAKDLTKELLDALRRWLQMATPWDIYLKTMLAFEDLQPLKMVYPKQPVSYQTDMIAQALRQIREYRGSMLVASTGLGKTVVAVHIALHLKSEDLIDNIMVIGPKTVEQTWKREFLSAGILIKYFVLKVLDKKGIKAVIDFEDTAITIVNQRWLVIVDESHELRNRYTDRFNAKTHSKVERHAFRRLADLTAHSNTKALLLTGSPYATDLDNINNQLRLLPHTGVNRNLLTEPEFAERAWNVEDTNEFINLPVASQLTTPHVATYYGMQDEKGKYITYGSKENQEHRYIPKVRLYSLEFPLDLEAELSPLIAQGYFDLEGNSLSQKNIERLVRVAWASSPLALNELLQKIIDTPGGQNAFEVQFKVNKKQRQSKLNPILKKLSRSTKNSDTKLRALVGILDQHRAQDEKIIIFCERRPTVVYLQEVIQKIKPELSIAATIERQADSFAMKKPHDVEKLIEAFAPKANDAKENLDGYDIFISTDAHGIGVNMQDAAVVVNYDIAWTPIEPTQRAGRILRFWPEARTVHVYTFVPTLSLSNPLASELGAIARRWNQLMIRHVKSTSLIDLPVLTKNQEQDIVMPDLASEITIRAGDLDVEQLSNLDISPYYQHTARLQQHRDYASNLSSDLISAKNYLGKHPAVCVLLQYDSQYYGLIYTPHDHQIRIPETVKLLDILQCEQTTPTATVDPHEIECLADSCVQAWCSKQQIEPEQVLRECSIYLLPKGEEKGPDALFNT